MCKKVCLFDCISQHSHHCRELVNYKNFSSAFFLSVKMLCITLWVHLTWCCKQPKPCFIWSPTVLHWQHLSYQLKPWSLKIAPVHIMIPSKNYRELLCYKSAIDLSGTFPISFSWGSGPCSYYGLIIGSRTAGIISRKRRPSEVSEDFIMIQLIRDTSLPQFHFHQIFIILTWTTASKLMQIVVCRRKRRNEEGV